MNTVPHMPVVLLMGTTASGKTELALELVRQFNCEIISVDSAMVYRGMNIGTAKPEQRILDRVPHRLINILAPHESYSCAQFLAQARYWIADIQARGAIPLLVGGTMLYFRALLHGLAPLPSACPTVRARLAEEANQLGWSAMHQRLQQLDPDSAQQIHPNDPQRIARALEIHALTGLSRTEHHQQSGVGRLSGPAIPIVLTPTSRAVLHQRIEQRFIQMLEHGFVEEVQQLQCDDNVQLSASSMRSVGYRQICSYLAGDYGYDEMVAKAMAASRQLAKRQLTWLRRDFAQAQWFAQGDEPVVIWLRKALRNFV